MSSVQTVLTELCIPFAAEGQHHHVGRGWIGLDCPWCSPRSGRYRLGVNLAGGYCNCWTCGGHRLADALAEITGHPLRDCYRLLDGVDHRRVKAQERKAGRLRVPTGVGPMGTQHRRYLRDRGFDPEEVERLWGVQGIGVASELQWRLWIPIHRSGDVVSWTTRAVGDAEARYVNARPEDEAVPAKHLLYGADYARHAVVVCEGPMDAWAIGPGAVATMGTAYSGRQLLAISEFPVRAICFDREPAAQRRARRLARELRGAPGETSVVELETGKDPAEASRDEIEQIRGRFLG